MTAELPELGESLRRQRLQRGLALTDGAAALGVPTKNLRALEWGRRDLLGDSPDAERIERQYAAFLGLEAGVPSSVAAKGPSRSQGSRADWFLLLAALAPPLVIALPLILEEVPLL